MPGRDDFERSFGGGTAMMIQIGHRKSRDIDIFLCSNSTCTSKQCHPTI
ncbi:nucleotidyl transferase AbiEii/AbiGii toxin family protein [Mesorhizobium sp. B2-1-3A]|nr:nucleotidyl transferase AbiEii/AbiGii toxin family protein [Mesorhizobium sp. B2-1-3A]